MSPSWAKTGAADIGTLAQIADRVVLNRTSAIDQSVHRKQQ